MPPPEWRRPVHGGSFRTFARSGGMERWFGRLVRRGFLLAMMAGALLIGVASLEYFQPDHLAPFVIEKLPVRYEALWRASLKVHVVSALVSFPLCLLLVTRTLRRHRTWHRWLGRIAGVVVVGALVPSGIVLSFEAKGGAPVALGFLLSAGVVLMGMVAGITAARRGDLRRHARGMRHVVAQLSVAVTSRALLILFHVIGMDPDTAYWVALWLPVLGSAALAEALSSRLRFSEIQFVPSILRNPS